jgi:antitoxin component of MazEF toxin-antitoxin module
MIKKLVKYGNSSAVVLDRAILELLEIPEGSAVKLRIEGNALVITPAQVKADEIPPSGNELLGRFVGMSNNKTHDNMINNMAQKMDAIIAENPDKLKIIASWAPTGENGKKLQDAFAILMRKYQADIARLNTEEFIAESQQLGARFNNDSSNAEHMEALAKLRLKYAPNLAQFDAEMKQAMADLQYPDFLKDTNTSWTGQ